MVVALVRESLEAVEGQLAIGWIKSIIDDCRASLHWEPCHDQPSYSTVG